MKFLREMRNKAEELGLKYVGLETRSRHYRMVFERKDGRQLKMTLSKGSAEPRHREKLNNERDIKNFAAGKEVAPDAPRD